MTGKTSRFRRRTREVLIWTAAVFVSTQLIAAAVLYSLRPEQRDVETIVRTERFCTKRHGSYKIPSLDESIIQWQFYHLFHSAEPQDVIFVGDSSCLMGVVPQRIQQTTGLDTWNFGLIGSLSTDGAAAVLETYLKKHGTVKLVICQVTPATLRRSKQEIERIGSLRSLEAWLSGGESDADNSNPLFRLPLFRLRPLIFDVASRRLFGRNRGRMLAAKRGAYPSDDDVRSTLAENRGFLSEAQTADLPEVEDDFDDLPHPDSLVGLQKMFQLSDRFGVPFLLVMSPRPEKHRSPSVEQAYRRLEAQLRAEAKQYTRVTVSLPLLRYFPDGEFATINHPRQTGALRNSDEMSRLIETQLGARDLRKLHPSPDSPDTVTSDEELAALQAMRLLVWAR